MRRVSGVTAVGRTAEEIRGRTKAVRQFHQGADQAIEQLLVLARNADAADPEVAAALLEAAREIGHSGQARQGQTVQVLAEADRVKTPCGGLAPWIAKHFDYTDSAARGVAQSARVIGHLPELSEPLSSGQIGTSTIRALTRAARAAKKADTDMTKAVTATLATATGEGVGEAVRRVRLLERATSPQRNENLLADQRRRSYLRIRAADSGMSRIEALLDPERATTVRTALDRFVSGLLHERRSEHGEPVAEHLRTVEQLQAHALTSLAESFADAEHADPAAGAQPAENLYGLLLSSSIPPRPAHLADLAEGAGSASYKTRPYSGFRRPAIWLPPLTAHHRIPADGNGPAPIRNPAPLFGEASRKTLWAFGGAAARLPG